MRVSKEMSIALNSLFERTEEDFGPQAAIRAVIDAVRQAEQPAKNAAQEASGDNPDADPQDEAYCIAATSGGILPNRPHDRPSFI